MYLQMVKLEIMGRGCWKVDILGIINLAILINVNKNSCLLVEVLINIL